MVKPGGRIGLANWTPDGFGGELFKVLSGHVPPPAGLRSPLEWGSEPRLVQLFGPRASDIRTRRRTYTFRYRSAEHWIEVFRAFYGPTHKAFAALDEPGRRRLHLALLDLLGRWSGCNGAGLCVPSDYLEVVVTR